MVATAPI